MKFMIELELRCWMTDCLTCGIVICCMPMTCYLLPRTPIKWFLFLRSSNKNLLTTIWSSTIRSVRSFPWTDNIGLLSRSFQYGTRIENVNVSKYLGSLLSSAACTTLEINSRISAGMDAVCSIRLFWRCDCPLLWKLAVYEAIRLMVWKPCN